MRLQSTLAPRMRQAPDGYQEGGSQPTDISVINRRLFLAPPLPMDNRHWDEDENVKKLLPTLDLGSHINAGCQPLPIAGATEERRLFPVACTPLILSEAPSSAYHGCILSLGNNH